MNEFENNNADLSNESQNFSNQDQTTNVQTNDPFANFNRPTDQLNHVNPQSGWQYQPLEQNNIPSVNTMPPPPPPPVQGHPNYQPYPYQPQQLPPQNYYPQQPIPPQYPPINPYSPMYNDPKRGMAITSMILGIVSVVLFCIPFFPILTGVVGIVLGVMSLKSSGRGMAISGIITSVLGGLFWVLAIIIPAIIGFLDKALYL